MAESPLDLVNRFCAAWEKGDLQELDSMLTPDVVYHNIPFKPVNGQEAVRKDFQSILEQFGPVRFDILRSAVNDNVVFNERIDHLTIKGAPFSLPVVGVFEVRDGKIAAWRDYFDAGKMRKAMSG